MDNYSLLLNSLYKPSSIYKEISSYRLSKQNIVEGAVLVCCISTLLSVAMGYFIMGSSEQMKELFSNESISFLFSPFATFLFELIFLAVMILSITFFGSFSKIDVDIETIGKLVIWLCFVSMVFKVLQLFIIIFSSNLYMIFRVLEMIWFVWALSSIVCELYKYKSVILTAIIGILVISFIMVCVFTIILSVIQFSLTSGPINV